MGSGGLGSGGGVAGVRVWGLGFGVCGPGCGVWDLGLEFRVKGSGFRM